MTTTHILPLTHTNNIVKGGRGGGGGGGGRKKKKTTARQGSTATTAIVVHSVGYPNIGLNHCGCTTVFHTLSFHFFFGFSIITFEPFKL